MDTRSLAICHQCSRAVVRRPLRPACNKLANSKLSTAISLFARNRPQQHEPRRQCRSPLEQNRCLITPFASVGPADLAALQERIQELADTILRPKDGPIPSEQRVLYVLEQIDVVARNIADVNSIAGAVSMNGSATSALLGAVNARRPRASVTKAMLLRTISKRAEEIVRDPAVFLTPAVLKAYVDLQKMLHQPASLPDIFELYANKPVPRQTGDHDITFTPSHPRSVKAAVDDETAQAALATAITAHDLDLALRIIDTSFAAPAYARAKVIRQCALPGAALTLLPAAVWGLSTQLSNWQSMMSQSHATGVAFAGIMTYVSVVGSMGYVVLTTTNDQMDRVTWAHGVPLWERWIRESERAAFDSIASAWGFQSSEKKGDEEGEDWAILKETCGRRGMELDKVELMQGMQ